jgi:tetratricopeptide (TPR) repeat protein
VQQSAIGLSRVWLGDGRSWRRPSRSASGSSAIGRTGTGISRTPTTSVFFDCQPEPPAQAKKGRRPDHKRAPPFFTRQEYDCKVPSAGIGQDVRTVGHGVRAIVPVLAVLAVMLGRPGIRAADAVSAAGLLDEYLSGRFDRAVAEAAAVEDAGDVRDAIKREGINWTNAKPEEAARRRLALATFVLEYTHARIETDWITLVPVIEWSCEQLRNGGPPVEAERTWHLATIALAGRARDFGRLTTDRTTESGRVTFALPPSWVGDMSRPMRRPMDHETIRRNAERTGHLAHILSRFPDEPRVVVAAAMMAVAPTDGEPTRNRSRVPASVVQKSRAARLSALSYLDVLRQDPSTAAEGHVRAGHIHYSVGSYRTALEIERLAQRTARDQDTLYLGHFLAGRILVAMDRRDEAVAEFDRALALRPRALSAALAMAALRVTAPAMDPPFAVLRRALDSHDPFDDPWRLYAYGDYTRFPALVAALRQAVK